MVFQTASRTSFWGSWKPLNQIFKLSFFKVIVSQTLHDNTSFPVGHSLMCPLAYLWTNQSLFPNRWKTVLESVPSWVPSSKAYSDQVEHIFQQLGSRWSCLGSRRLFIKGFWPLAKVLELHIASEETVSIVTLQTCQGKKVRSVNKLSRVFNKEWFSLASFFRLYLQQAPIFAYQLLQTL